MHVRENQMIDPMDLVKLQQNNDLLRKEVHLLRESRGQVIVLSRVLRDLLLALDDAKTWYFGKDHWHDALAAENGRLGNLLAVAEALLGGTTPKVDPTEALKVTALVSPAENQRLIDENRRLRKALADSGWTSLERLEEVNQSHQDDFAHSLLKERERLRAALTLLAEAVSLHAGPDTTHKRMLESALAEARETLRE
jgi:hypothetical protein